MDLDHLDPILAVMIRDLNHALADVRRQTGHDLDHL